MARFGATAAVLALLVPFGAAMSLGARADEAACDKLMTPHLFADTTVTAAHAVAATGDQPAMCEATATIAPVPQSHIGVVYRLPATWNHRMLGLGGGGWAGNIKLETAAPALARGYATAQTDGGHPGTVPFDTDWVTAGTPEQNQAALTDFAYRAIHLMTAVGKQVVATYYGHPQSHAYFQGCSTGGRQGLMEVQRYPSDYEGVISGAPVYDLVTQTTGLVRGDILDKANLSEGQLKRLNNAVLGACDAADGLKDGIVTDPRACHFDPGVLQCKVSGSGGDCLAPDQVEAVRKAYQGVVTASGEAVAYPAAPGSELGWRMFSHLPGADKAGPGGLGNLRGAMFGDPKFDLAGFNPDRDFDRMMQGAFAKAYDANNPDIGAFTKAGGKLLMWHGFYDPGPSPLATIAYYDRVEKAAGGPITASARLFLAPGVYHCRGGPGPDQIDTLTALEQWVEAGKAPDRLIATKKDAKLSRPLCPYPALPRYNGSGDPDDAASFVCK